MKSLLSFSKLCSLLILVSFCICSSAQADLTTSTIWKEKDKGKLTGLFKSKDNVSLKMTVQYSDKGTFDWGYLEDSQDLYGASQEGFAHLFMDQGKDIEIKMDWDEVDSFVIKADLLVYEENESDNMYQNSNYLLWECLNPEETYIFNYSCGTLLITDGCGKTSVFENVGPTFDIIGQMESMVKCGCPTPEDDEVAIGFRLDFGSKCPTPTVPAPGAIMLSTLGTMIAGRMRRRQ